MEIMKSSEESEERKELKERFIKNGVPFLVKLEKAEKIDKEENSEDNTYSVIVNGHVQKHGSYDEMLQEYKQCIFVHG